MQKYNFRQCTLSQLDDLFGLQQTFASPPLEEWLASTIPLSADEIRMLQWFQELLRLNRNAWNEQELSLNFIGPIFALARFTEPYRFNLFSERRLSAIVTGVEHDVELSGEPDGILATGFRDPKIPFFAFTEYKKQFDVSGDPAGQTLAAMLVGQVLNQQRHPLYGAYVSGSDWNFMLLGDQRYAISRDYSALSDELFDIFRILKALKQIVLNLTAVQTPA